MLDKGDEDFGSTMRLFTGTLYHRAVERWLGLHPPDGWVVEEIEWDVTSLLPTGWTGTLDYLFWNKETNLRVIEDLKTIKPEGIDFIGGEPKEDHVTQVSCYHAAVSTVMDNLSPDIHVCYLPKDKKSNGQVVLPKMTTAKAHSKTWVWSRLNLIKKSVDEYLEEYQRTDEIINDYLAPMPDPELKMYWDREAQNWVVKSVPHWTCQFNDYGPELTPKQSTNIVGRWSIDGYYHPRKGWEFVEEKDVPRPSPEDFRKRQV